jgi:hypothetical protein
MKGQVILVLIFTFLLNTVQAQKCEYLTNGKDEFTGIVKLETWGKLIREFTGSNGNLILGKANENYYLLLNYNVQVPKSLVVGKNDRIMFKLENDSILNFLPIEVKSGELITLNGITTTQIKVSYFATKEQIQALSQFVIKKVRIYFSDGYREHETKSKNTSEIKAAAMCLLK